MKKKIILLNVLNYILFVFLITFPYNPYSWFNGFARIGIFMMTSFLLLLLGAWLHRQKRVEYENLISIHSVINAINFAVLPIIYIIYSTMP